MKNWLMLILCFISFNGIFLPETFASSKSLYDMPLKFKSEKGTEVQLSEWKDHNVILTMAYATCHSTCPLTMKKLKAIQEKMGAKASKVEFVIVSFDSGKDTPESLMKYSQSKEPNWHFLVGNEKDTRTLSMLLGIKFNKNPKSGEIMHDNKIVLLNKKGEMVHVLTGLDADIENLPLEP